MRYLLKSTIMFILLISCRAYNPTSEKEIYTLIERTYSSKEKLYYKTLEKSDLKIFIEKVDLKLWNNNLSKGLVTGGEVDYRDIFNKEELDLILDQLKSQEQLKLNSNLIRRKNLLTKSKSGGVHQISKPVFVKNHTFSFIFRKKHNGGEDIVVYKKVNNEWRIHSVITLSMV